MNFGCIPSLLDQRNFAYSVSNSILSNLPQSIDLRPEMPKTRNQGLIASCTAHAIAANIEYCRKKQGFPSVDLSRLFIYYNTRSLRHAVNSDTGASLTDTLYSVKQNGVCLESQWPYDGNPFPDDVNDQFLPNNRFNTKPAPNCYTTALQYNEIIYEEINRNLNQLKGCLANGFPFVFGFVVYRSFNEISNSGRVKMPLSNEPGGGRDGSLIGHAVIAVGYNDIDQTIIFQNSMGEHWGDGGYGYIPYAYLLNRYYSYDFYTIRSVSQQNP